jgi:hypothetical protein
MRKYPIAIPSLGVAVCLMGAALMAFGQGLLGESHTGIATVTGILGIGIIASSKISPKKSSTGGEVND